MKISKTTKVVRVWPICELKTTDPYPYGDPLEIEITSIDYNTMRISISAPVYPEGAWTKPVIIIPEISFKYKINREFDTVIFKSKKTLCQTFNVDEKKIKSIIENKFIFKGIYRIYYLEDILPQWRNYEMFESLIVKLYL